jgi:hypothetical protein
VIGVNGTPRRASTLRRVGVGLFALASAIQICATQISTIALLAQQPAAAMHMPFGHARPDAMLAWQLADEGAPAARVAQMAAAANVGTPLDEPAFAAAARAAGGVRSVAGTALLDHAWRLSRRDPFVLQALFDRARAQGNAPDEIAAMTALLQLQVPAGHMREDLVADMSRPAVFAQSVAMMRANPHWRHGFFAGLHVAAPQVPALAALVAALRESGAPLASEDMAELLGPLMYHGKPDPALADQLWRAWLGQGDPWAWPADSESTSHLPFDWTLGSATSLVDLGNRRAVKFTGKDGAAVPVATKVVYLPAGRYQFVAKPDRGLADSAISAILVCDAQNLLLANGATWQTDHACHVAELRLLADSTDGTILSAGLRSVTGG